MLRWRKPEFGRGNRWVSARMEFPVTATMELPLELTVPRDARNFVACVLQATHAPVDADAAKLVTSELVTNAIRVSHDDPVTLRVLVNDRRLRIEVSDWGPGTPRMQTLSDPYAEGGRGLAIVDLIAAAWGVHTTRHGGKTVWAELVSPSGSA